MRQTLWSLSVERMTEYLSTTTLIWLPLWTVTTTHSLVDESWLKKTAEDNKTLKEE